MTDKPKSKPLAMIDDQDAPVIFADELTGGGFLQGNFNMTFSVVQYDHSKNPPQAYRRTCLRLVLPAPAVEVAVRFLTQQLDHQARNDKKPEPNQPIKLTLQ